MLYECVEQAGIQYRKKRRNYERSQHHVVPRDVRRRHDGARKMRRFANLCDLTNAFERDEDESRELDYVDLVPARNTAFTELHQESEKMSAWNDFVNLSEEDQRRTLVSLRRAVSDSADAAAASPKLPATVCSAAAECFLRISHDLRQCLRRNQFPKGELQRQEDELVEFFQRGDERRAPGEEESVFRKRISDGFHRMLLHAVSQYLDLISYSKDVGCGSGNGSGSRQTEVKVKRPPFMPPSVSLARFLTDKQT